MHTFVRDVHQCVLSRNHCVGFWLDRTRFHRRHGVLRVLRVSVVITSPHMKSFKEGLEDVVATSSSICYIDGDKGILSYRGYNIHDLADYSTFEETAHLLWFGALPTQVELADTRRRMAASRSLPRQVQDLLWGIPKDALPMDVLRTAVSMLGHFDPDVRSNSPDANARKALRLTGQVAGIVAAFHRIRQGRSFVEPRAELSHAANFLYMVNGEMPSPAAQKAFDVALILHADHELNA